MPTTIDLYTTSTCPFCIQAKALLDHKGLDYTEHVMDGKRSELDAKKREFGHHTVPIVVIDGICIGGATELSALDRAGGLG